MKRKKGTLRLNAARAKTRLTTGYWQSKQQESHVNKNINSAKFTESARTSTGITRNTYDIYYGKLDSEEEITYRRIAAQLNMGNSDNLLGSILDRVYMATLNETERQRYVFNMSAMLQRSIERYNKVVC